LQSSAPLQSPSPQTGPVSHTLQSSFAALAQRPSQLFVQQNESASQIASWHAASLQPAEPLDSQQSPSPVAPHTAHSVFAMPAQRLSQVLSQQNESCAHTVSSHPAFVHPGPSPAEQQSPGGHAPQSASQELQVSSPLQLLSPQEGSGGAQSLHSSFAALAQRLSQLFVQQNESPAQISS